MARKESPDESELSKIRNEEKKKDPTLSPPKPRTRGSRAKPPNPSFRKGKRFCARRFRESEAGTPICPLAGGKKGGVPKFKNARQTGDGNPAKMNKQRGGSGGGV